jgi:FAD synthase
MSAFTSVRSTHPSARRQTFQYSILTRERRHFSSATASQPRKPPSRKPRKQSTGLVLVAGKFDALHRGHRELARAAARMDRGLPTLLSFSGMAAALGWPPRASVVAPVERAGILRDWSVDIGAPVSYRALPFAEVRTLSPRDFIDMAREDLGAAGIVCGPDWRFGHRATGDVELLRGIAADSRGEFAVCVVDPVGLVGEPDVVVSSTSVRLAIAAGDVALARRMMDRPHRLVGLVTALRPMNSYRPHVEVQCGEFVNQVPGDGFYACDVRMLGHCGAVKRRVSVRRDVKTRIDVDDGTPPTSLPAYLDDVGVFIEDDGGVFPLSCDISIDFFARLDVQK